MRFSLLTAIVSSVGLVSSLLIPQTPFTHHESPFINSIIGKMMRNEMSPQTEQFWRDKLASDAVSIANAAEIEGTPFEPQEFEGLATHESYANHKIRYKIPEGLGIEETNQLTGYFDMDESDKHLFFWFFESRNDPATDPIVLWLNGGPGCSSMMGLFFELGPMTITPELKPIKNPYSWTNNASVIFLDSPVNTGYSYSSGSVNNTFVTSHDVIAFLDLFFIEFPQFQKVPFHIAGESYAGHYVPRIGKDIIESEGLSFELLSILVGNGLTDVLVQYEYYQPMACGEGGYPAVVNETTCAIMKSNIPECIDLIKKCYETESPVDCFPAVEVCNESQMLPYSSTGYNMYDVTMKCEGNSLCYDAIGDIQTYLDSPEVKKAVGAEVTTYLSCNHDINLHFRMAGDWMQSYFRDAIHDVVESGLPVLIYSGDRDFICNWLGGRAWVDQLKWSGSEKWAETEVDKWYNGKEHAGNVKNVDNLTFLQVFEAGHMVPFDQPANSLEMFNKWLAGDKTFA